MIILAWCGAFPISLGALRMFLQWMKERKCAKLSTPLSSQCLREPPSTGGTSFYLHTKSLEIIQHSKQLWKVEKRCSFDTGGISRSSWPQTSALQGSLGKFQSTISTRKMLLVQPPLTSFFLSRRWRLIVASSTFNELHLFFSDTGAGTLVGKKFTAFMTGGDTCSVCIL